MLKSLIKYAKSESDIHEPVGHLEAEQSTVFGDIPPVIWESNNISQIHSLLVLRQAELEVAKAKLTGNDRIDWYVTNKIMDLEIKIADLKLWLKQAMKNEE